MSRKALDLKGLQFEKLEVIERAPENNPAGKSMWICQCDCGNTTIVSGNSLKTGNTKSCGCLKERKGIARRFKHGQAKTPLYVKWHGIIQLCTYKYHPAYDHYHSKGITVCEEWLNSLDNFISWALANGYKEGMTLRRKDKNGPFSPDNCFFVTTKKREVMNHG